MTPDSPGHRTHLFLSLLAIAFALALAFLWVPFDSDSGVIEAVRRHVIIGDALAPTLAAGIIGLGGALLFFDRRARKRKGVTAANFLFLAQILAICLIALTLMRWTGPLAVAIAGNGELDYRLLRNTAPWKYLGFLAGGTFLIAGLIARTEGRLTPRSVFVAAAAIILLIALYDLPFEDLLLPPNGDV